VGFSVKNKVLRSIFQREMLPDLFLHHQDVFFGAFNKGPDAVNDLLMDMWAYICNQDGDHVNNHPLDIKIEYLVFDDSDDDFTVLAIMELPNIKKLGNLAIYFAVFFGVKKELRLFLGETDYRALGNRYIFVVELKRLGEGFVRHNHCMLHRGSNNEPYFFEKPKNPRKPDVMCGIDPEEERPAFIDHVAQICLLHQDG
jgi:hypothetical protein